MGREIRRVPQDWEHPRNDKGDYISMADQDYETAAKEWLENCALWQTGVHPHQADYCRYYWEYAGAPPDQEGCRPAFTSEPTAYQIYETVSEGSPTSPVFNTEQEMREWLIQGGHSASAADNFISGGWAPSMIVRHGPQGTSIKEGIHAMEDAEEKTS